MSFVRSRIARGLAAAVLGCLVLVTAGCSSTSVNSEVPWTDPALGGQRAKAVRVTPRTPQFPTTLPPTLPGQFVPRCVNAPAGWLAHELARPGVVDVVPPLISASRPRDAAFGYLDRSYAACGQTIGLHLAAASALSVTVEAIRVGAYPGGFGGRVVWTSPPARALPSHGTVTQGRATEVDRWPTSLALHPTAAWPPGAYVLKVTTVGRPAAFSYVPLRILSSGHRASYLAISSDLTDLAYNPWGGRSLYLGFGHTPEERRVDRAYVASPDRPLISTGLRAYFTMDLPLATFADRHRLTIDWTTDTSLDADPRQVEGRSSLVLPGHSEYWTTRTYDALAFAEGRGTNVMVLGGNEVYWHARLTRDAHTRVTAMTVVRSASIDVSAAPADKTVRWADAPLRRDEARMTGLATVAVGLRADARVVASPQWLFQRTGLRSGSMLPSAFGNEADGPEGLGGHSPANLQELLGAWVVDTRRHLEHITSAYFSASSGAGVFNAATTEWLCGIANVCPDGLRPAVTVSALDQITLNVFKAFSTPRAGLRHPSEPTGTLRPSGAPTPATDSTPVSPGPTN